MGSIIEQSFENSTLANLSKAFEATWEVLHTRNPPRDADAEDDLRLAVSGKLLELAANGVTDPKELQNRVLESLDGNGPAPQEIEDYCFKQSIPVVFQGRGEREAFIASCIADLTPTPSAKAQPKQKDALAAGAPGSEVNLISLGPTPEWSLPRCIIYRC